MNLAALFLAASVAHGLPSGLLSAICWVESNHRPRVIHLDDGEEDSIGVCQLHPSTARFMGFKGKKKDLLRPEVNIEYAARYFKYQLERYGTIPRAVTAYNQGHAYSARGSKYYRKVQARWDFERNQERRALARRSSANG